MVFVVSACAVFAFPATCITAEILAATDDEDDNPFITLDDDEDELETNELTVEYRN